MRVYAIGDIHGHLDLLNGALARVAADRAACGDRAAPLVQIGDLVDRGPDSRGVIEALRRLCADDPRVVVLLGNHDQMLAQFLDPPEDGEDPSWIAAAYLGTNMGGRRTLASYGVDTSRSPGQIRAAARDLVPASHVAFLHALRPSHRHGDCFFAHAGIRPGVPLDRQDPDDLCWIRDEFLTDPSDHGPLIVHGHTPVPRVEHHGNRLAIDTGAAYGGPLSAVVIEGREAWLLTDDGRVPV